MKKTIFAGRLLKNNISLGLTLSLCSFASTCAAFAEDRSLIESALDGTYFESKPPVKPVATSPAASEQKRGSAATEKSKPVAKKTAETSPPAPAVTLQPVDGSKSNVVLTPPKYVEREIPAPKDEVLQSPIHSSIQANTKSIMRVPLGTKYGKTIPIDTTYRGQPAIPKTETVTVGTPSWAPVQKKKLASAPVAGVTPAVVAPITVPSMPAPVNKTETTLPAQTAKPETEAVATVNVRIQTPQHLRSTDSIWIYPYPPKPPKAPHISPLSEDPQSLKNQILQFGYSARPDLDRPYPAGGWRWVHAFQTGVKKSGQGTPHTMFTMYHWVDKVFPYILAECHELNLLEQARSERFLQVCTDYERVHTDIEAQATTKGLTPFEVKVNQRGIAQMALPPGNWWLAATRKQPGLQFYWQVPLTSNSNQPMAVQLSESNALIIGGGW